MLLDFPYRHAVLVALCLVPAATSWGSGRSLLAQLDDPLLPERLLVHRRRNQRALVFTVAVIVVLGGLWNLAWTIPLTILLRSAAGYRLRRALYEERWSFVGYMAGMGRLLLALVGPRLLLAGAPLLAGAAGSFEWIAALAIGALLLLWQYRSAEWYRAMLRARPLGESPLLARFQAIAAASTAPQPRFEFIDLRGGAIANAVALPSRRGSSVLYTDTLLRLLDSDEATAITAHEIAHLEYYDAARLRWLNRMMSALIGAATAAALVPRLMPGVSLLTIEAVWGVVYVVVLGWIARDRQRNETASDLRAVQLCGDPDALVRALIKIHAFARLPRRWDTQMEHSATHPSLARRIRAISGAAGAVDGQAPSAGSAVNVIPGSRTVPDAVQSALQPGSAPETIRSADGRTAITFADSLHWQEADGGLHVLPYAQLTELRVAARSRADARLIALERGGRRWEAALEAAEAARAQAILDRVDVRLGEPAARSHAVAWLKAAGAIVAIGAMWAGQIVVVMVALAASTRSAAAFYAAAGASALAAAALAGRQMLESGDHAVVWPALLMAVFGTALLAGAWRKRADDRSPLVDLGMAALALFAVVSVAVIVMRGRDAVGLYRASVALPSGAILPLALGAGLAIRPRRAWRLAALPICLVGLMIGVAGSGTFLHAFGRDPFLVAVEPLPIDTVTGSPFADFELAGMLTGVGLSPRGERVALVKYTGGMGYGSGFAVGKPGSEFTSIGATDLLFLDDEHVLVTSVEGARTRLQQIALGSNAVIWERWIDDLSGRLAYRRRANRWVVAGMDADGRVTSAEGVVGNAGTTRRQWNVTDREEAGDAWATNGDVALRAQRTFGFDPLASGALSLTMAAMLDQMETRLTRITPAGQTQVAVSRLETNCTDRALDGEQLVCTAYDGARTHVLSFAPKGDVPEPIGSVGGRFFASRPASEGWLSGWTMKSTGAVNMPTQVAIDVVSRRVVAFPPELRAEEVTVAGKVAAVLTHSASSTRVRLFRLDR